MEKYFPFTFGKKNNLGDLEQKKSLSLFKKAKSMSHQKDWICTCSYKNHARNKTCRKCKSPKSLDSKARSGDWKCDCGFTNFASRLKCHECSSERTKVSGDWLCEICKFYVFRSKKECTKCGTKRPDVAAKLEAKAGDESELDGKCLACLNFKANMILIKSGHLCVCEECSTKIANKCPMCRETFNETGIRKVFAV